MHGEHGVPTSAIAALELFPPLWGAFEVALVQFVSCEELQRREEKPERKNRPLGALTAADK